MSRRKQAKPQHIAANEDDLTTLLDTTGPKSVTVDNEDEEEERESPIDAHICGNCRQEFLGLSHFLTHKKECTKKTSTEKTDQLLPQLRTGGKEEDDVSQELDDDKEMIVCNSDDEPEDEEEENESKFFDREDKTENKQILRRVCDPNDSPESRLKQMASTSSAWPFVAPALALSDTNVVLESLQNTSVAVAQHPPPTTPDLIPQALPQAALQSTLFNLQQQQMMLFHVIHQLQSQIAGSGQTPTQLPAQLMGALQASTSSNVSDKEKSQLLASALEKASASSTMTSLQTPSSKSTTAPIKSPPVSSPAISTNLASGQSAHESVHSNDESDQPIMSSMKSSPLDEPSSPGSHEPNTLELLQRHTEQALQNTMSGGSFLLNGIAGMGGSDFLSFRKTKDGKEDPMYRHRCKFCGKVFGSDSALQIHIRSHTGERPFKCNICGNRFTTKGNLKVHFQRHKAKYPHIKMNPHPVPEHLDKFHPPIEPPTGSQSPTNLTPMSTPPMSMSGVPPLISQSLSSITQSFLDSNPMKRVFGSSFSKNILDVNNPDLSQSENTSALLRRNNSSDNISNQSLTDDSDQDIDETNEIQDMEDISEDEKAVNLAKIKSTIKAEESPLDLQHIPKDEEMEEINEEDEISEDDLDREIDEREIVRREMTDKDKENINSDDELSDDSHDGLPPHPGVEFGYMPHFPPYFSSGPFPGIPTSLGMMPFGFPPGLPPLPNSGPPNSDASGESNRDPVFYQDLLPKPGSTDNTWETLMEVQKASETVKLQQLVDNIEHKLTDPNQCIICHRVLSCKSALQMHYRTHTGERPFKCKICGRAFTTKGNLKTHMGVHRVKPPLRILHQCPVCHKQFTNALVLQQHIRMHTGEPTDIPPEHIMANEIKAPALMPFQRGMIGPHFTGPLPPPGSMFGPPFMNGLTTSSSLHIPLSAPITSFSVPKPITSPGSPIEKNSNDETIECKRESISPSVSNRSSRASTPKSIKVEASDVKSPNQTASRSPSPKSPSPKSPPPKSPTPASIPQPVIVSTPNRSLPSSAPQISSTKSNDSVNSNFSTSLTALENHVKTINSSVPQPMPFGPFGLGLYNLSQFQRLDSEHGIRMPPNTSAPDLSVQTKTQDKCSPHMRSFSPSSLNSKITSEISADERSLDSSLGTMDRSSPATTPSGGALDLTPKTNSIQTSVSQDMGLMHLQQNPDSMEKRFFPPPFSALQFPTGRPNTTCRICLKTFACYSALEIHYRSHTKERPFKCDYCDRGFSTKGNMKQHMLTHKIRDLPPDLYTTTTTTNSSTSLAMALSNETSPTMTNNGNSTPVANMSTNSNASSGVSHSPTPNGNSDSNEKPSDRSDPGTSSKLNPKHVCRVCHKPFSSGSALQIHMRTHTGDKPFKCTICGRAFTTKGNLKVHMGTHMWSNGSSRRGRRMSIDLPNLHISPPKQTEFGSRTGSEIMMAHFN